jgi:hypothetical protein
MKTKGTCPVCNGSGRMPVPEWGQKYKRIIAGYDKVTDTFKCNNCGGQYMMGVPSGQVNLREDGTPCTHDYDAKKLGNCYYGHVCKHCGDQYAIDSGD